MLLEHRGSSDNAFIIMQSGNNVIASLHSSATQWRHKFLLELCFEEGYINLDGILSGTRSYAPETLIIEGENLKMLLMPWANL